MIILGIETSCDETAISVIRSEGEKIEILSNVVSSQIKLHAEWGGVVPNLAAREHLKNILPVLEESLKNAQISQKDIDLIAVTEGPGLIPALLIGTNFAKTLSYLLEKPLIGIHHIEGHIYANFANNEEIKFPLLALVVSGGHTQLVLMKDHLQYEIVGQTQDDAVGEAFDKVARILGLGYPGGPIVERVAQNVEREAHSVGRISLPRPMLSSPDFNFSFSGLKTAVLYAVKKLEEKNSIENFRKMIPEICHEFQQACIDVLVKKTIRAARKYSPQTIIIAGGVSANKELKRQLKDAIEANLSGTKFSSPKFEYSLDNAAMIAVAGKFRWEKMSAEQKKESFQNWKTLQANANLRMSQRSS